MIILERFKIKKGPFAVTNDPDFLIASRNSGDEACGRGVAWTVELPGFPDRVVSGGAAFWLACCLP
jgi:hypothetical protein